MEDCNSGHSLTFGSFCGAFSVVSVEICAIWPTLYLNIIVPKKMGVITTFFVVISTIFPPNFTKTSYPQREQEREERSGDKMIMMECLGLSFLDRKVTKVVTNSASIRRLACHSGITVDASLRLSLYKTKAQAKQEHWNYLSKRARGAVLKSKVPCKRRKNCWHTKQLDMQQDSAARAGRSVLLWSILLGHNNSDPFPNSPLLPRDMPRDSPQMECNRARCMSSSVAEDNSPQGSNTEGCLSSSSQEDNSPQGALKFSPLPSLHKGKTPYF
jgi:hypothetical protein